MAQPTGPSLVAGQAQISAPSANATVINQSSAKAIINWQDFSVAAGGSVQFNQPNSAAITLNRVVGPNASDIEGAVRANGQVWLLNPNGVLFGQGATINVGGLLATTSDIANNDFLNGNYSFSGANTGSVVNNGAIHAARGGSVVLSAPNVANNGLVHAKAGHVVLGGVDTFTVDFNGDHLLSYAVGAGDAGTASNTGTIKAPGGQVLLTARAAVNVADGVVNNSGIVEATSARVENGEIILDAGDTTNSGTLDASGKQAGQTGGDVQVLGNNVQVTDGAKIDVSGDAGGGQVLIGGNFHGAGPQRNAQTTSVGQAVIKADAVSSGNGGKVAVWSDGATQFAGSISAEGGAQGGNGGQVETSGHTLGVAASARVDTSAPQGVTGSWLLDPTSINIVASGGNDDAGLPTVTYGGTPSPATIDANAIVSSLQGTVGPGTNVTLQANGDITVSAPIAATASTILELDAGHSIILNASITVVGGTIILTANNPNAGAGNALDASISGSAALTASTIGLLLDNSSGGSIGTSGTPLNISSSSGTLSLSVNTQGASVFLNSSTAVSLDVVTGIPQGGVNLTNSGNFNLTAAGTIAQTQVIKSNDLNVTATGANNTITLTDVSNLINGSARFNADADVQYVNDTTGTLPASVLGASNITNGDLTVTTASTYLELFDNSGALKAANVTLTNENAVPGDKRVTQAFFPNGLPIVTGNLTVNMSSTGGSIILGNTFVANAVTGTVTLNAGTLAGVGFYDTVSATLGAPARAFDDLQVTISDPSGLTSPSLTLAGTIQATSSISISAVGGIVYTGGSGLISPSISLTSFGGPIGASGFAIPVSNSGGTLSLAVSNLGTTGDAYLTSTSAVSIDGSAALSGGTFDLETSGATSDITVNSAIVTSANPIVLQSERSIILKANVIDTGGTIYVAADSQNVAGSSAVISDNGSSILSASAVVLQMNENQSGNGFMGSSVNPILLNSAGAASMNLAVSTVGANAFVQSQAPVAIYTIDSVLSVQGVTVGSGNFTLTAAGSVSQSWAVNAAGLTVTTTGAGNTITLNDPGNVANNDPGNIITGTARFSSASDVSYTNADINDTDTLLGSSTVGGNLTVVALNNRLDLTDSSGNIHVTGNTSLSSPGALAEGLFNALGALNTGLGIPLVTQKLTVSAGGAVTLTNAANQISGAVAFTATRGGDFVLDNAVSTTLGTSSAQGNFTIVATGNLTIASGAVISPGASDKILLAATGNFINNAGAGALSFPNGGLFQIYSSAPAGDVFGSLDSGNNAVWNTTYPTAISQSGDRYVFAFQPTITVTANAASKSYGTDDTAAVAAGFSISGLQNGATNAYLVDTAALVYSGAPTITSTGSAAGASVSGSPYTITAAAGSFSVGDGYRVAFQNGALTVNPVTLTYTVAAAGSRVYGAANPAFSGTVSGFVNGDTQTSATTGTLSFASAATAASGVGSYAVNGSGLSATNYVFVQAAGNATALTITPATLTYVAGSASRAYGSANPAFTGSVTGFLNGDTQTSATTGTLSFVTSATTASNVGAYAINGAGLSAANYVFVQAAANAADLTITRATLTLALTGTVSKTFDGTTAATLTASNYSALGGIVSGDSVSLAAFPTSGTYDTADVGARKTVTVTGLSLSGASAANYTIASSVSGAVGVILAAGQTTTGLPPALIGFQVTTQNGGQNGGQQPPTGGAPPLFPPGILVALGGTTPPQPPPPPPGGQGNDQTADGPPTQADQATSFVANSLDGAPPPGGNGGVIIPGLLHTAAAPQGGQDGNPGNLSGWGNSSLWQ